MSPPAGADLHARAVVVDAHCDTLLDVACGRRRLDLRSSTGHIDLPRLRAGGVDVQVFALFTEPQYKPERALARTLQLLDAAYETGLRPCHSFAELASRLDQGELAAVLALEGGEAIGTDLARLRCLTRLGVRLLGLVWNQRNAIGDGVGEARGGAGLTEFGRAVVRECDRLGVIVDVSHLNERGFWDVLAEGSRPVVASHSDARALCDHPRNLTDAQLRALAANGGVIGINFHSPFLRADGERAGLTDVVRHIDHVCGLVGPGHVGLGSDFDGIPQAPMGLEDAARLPALTEALLAHGYTEPDILAILGGNFLRVLHASWAQ